MRIGRDDAVGILQKWMEDRLRVRCQGSFGDYAFGSWGFIKLVSPREVRIAGEHEAELVVRLHRNLNISYDDSRIVKGAEKEQFDSAIVIVYGDIPAEGDLNTIVIAAVKN